MPIEYANLIELRLDSNTLFYQLLGGKGYTLVEMFAVKGGKPIIQELGSWSKSTAIQLLQSKERWNRRTDLKGAEAIETLTANKNFGEPQYDNKGTLVGSVQQPVTESKNDPIYTSKSKKEWYCIAVVYQKEDLVKELHGMQDDVDDFIKY